MAMPIRMFWSAQKYVDRLRAERDLRALNIAVAAAAQGDQETLPALREALTEQLGTVSKQREVVSSKNDLLAFAQANAAS